MKTIRHGDVDYPLFVGFDDIIAFYSALYVDFNLEETCVLTDFCDDPDNWYWLYQIFFSFVSNGERVYDSVVVAVED